MKKTPTKYPTIPPFFSHSGVSPQLDVALRSFRVTCASVCGTKPSILRVKLPGSLSPEYSVTATVVTAAAITSSWVLCVE
jgi:hypothetical protein